MYKIIGLGLMLLAGCKTAPTGDEIIWENELAEGRLMYGHVSPDTQVFIQNEERQVGATGLFEIPVQNGRFTVGIPQDAKELNLKLKQKGHVKDVRFNLSKRQWQEDYVSGLPPKKVNPPETEQQRIQDEFSAMRQQRLASNFPQFPDAWQKPIKNYKRISSPFGSRRILNGQVKQGHSGTDYAADMDTPVYAANTGKVVLTHPDMFYSGATILIDHGAGVYTSYAHLSQIDVHAGDIVKAGDKIGAVGMSGRATGPHLHFGLSWYNVRLNPEDLYPPEIHLTQKDNHQEISAQLFQNIQLKIPENPTTGYRWHFETDNGVLTETDNNFIPPNTTLVGAGGLREMTWQVHQTGTSFIRGFYYRPWEKRPQQADFELKIIVP